MNTTLHLLCLAVLCVSTHAQTKVMSMEPLMNNNTDKQAAAIVMGIPVRELREYQLIDFFKGEIRKQGIIIFRDQGTLTVDDVKKVANYFGSKLYESRPFHAASGDKAVYALSNDEEHGDTSLLHEDWHNDGCKRAKPLTHNVYHATSRSVNATSMFISLDDFVGSLQPETKALWDRIWIRFGGNKTTAHPLIFHHPATKFETMLFHLDKVREMFWDYGSEKERLATEEEKVMLVHSLRAELNTDSGRHHYLHQWREGDVIVTDNLITVHREHPDSVQPSDEVGVLQILSASVLGRYELLKVPGTPKQESMKLADEEEGDFDNDDGEIPQGMNMAPGEGTDDGGEESSVTMDATHLFKDSDGVIRTDDVIDLNDMRDQQDDDDSGDDDDVTDGREEL